MKAFHNDPVQKEKFVSIMQKAYDEKRLESGKYWCKSDCTGCLVGQIAQTEDSPHKTFAKDFNCPEWIPKLFDNVFEGLPDGKREQFAINVVNAIPVGFDNWQSWYHRFCIFLLEDVCQNTDNPTVIQVIVDIISLHKSEETDEGKWSTACVAAWSAAWSASSAARSAAWSASSAAWSARSAAWYARSAESAESAARSAESAARSAAWSASSARSAAYVKIAKKIILLFEETTTTCTRCHKPLINGEPHQRISKTECLIGGPVE